MPTPPLNSPAQPPPPRSLAKGGPLSKGLQPPVCGLSFQLVIGAGASSFLFGYSICVVNSCLELIAVKFQWCGNDWEAGCVASRSNQGLVNACLYLGAAGGALLAGRPAMSSRGSRFALLVSDALFAAGALCCLAAQGAAALVIGRLVSGVGLGLCAINGPLYMAEVSPRERRGLNSAMHGVFITLGLLASIAMGIPQDPPPQAPGDQIEGLNRWYWRFLLGAPLVIAAAQALLLGILRPIDPPNHMVSRGDLQGARRVLYAIYGMPEPGGTGTAVDLRKSGQAALELQLQELREASASAKSVPRIFMSQAVRDPFLRTAVCLGVALAAFQQLSGINGLMSYSNSLFASAGIPPRQLTLASTLMGIGNVFASLTSSRVVDRWGRRRLLVVGTFLQTCAMLALATLMGPWARHMMPEYVRGPAAVAVFTLFVMAFSLGPGAITWVYLSEIYPMEIRGASLSLCGVVNWICSSVVVFGTRFLTLWQACHVFGFVSLAALLCTYLWVVETKGCSMDDSPLTPKSGRLASPLLAPGVMSPPGAAAC